MQRNAYRCKPPMPDGSMPSRCGGILPSLPALASGGSGQAIGHRRAVCRVPGLGMSDRGIRRRDAVDPLVGVSVSRRAGLSGREILRARPDHGPVPVSLFVGASGLGFGHPLEAITYAKMRTLRQLAALWMRETPHAGVEHPVGRHRSRINAGSGAVPHPCSGGGLVTDHAR
jgi:hypothetical protein